MSERKKTENLTLRLDPKTRFVLDFIARSRGQNITTVIERVIQEAAQSSSVQIDQSEYVGWEDLWHVNDGVRYLRVADCRGLFPTFDEEYTLNFAKIHWPFFYTGSNCKNQRVTYIEVLWPGIQKFIQLWNETKSTDYWAAGKAMQEALKAANVRPPDWPVKPTPKPVEDNEIPF